MWTTPPALGYKPLWYTLGEQEFKLKCKEGTADVWGRPSDTWTYNTGDKETVIEQAAAYTTNVRVDECDIAEALGLNKATAIESAYIDGETQSVTMQRSLLTVMVTLTLWTPPLWLAARVV